MENITLLEPEEIEEAHKLASSSPNPAIRRRALILLGYNSGANTREVAEEVKMSLSRVRYWRRQYWKKGMAIFEERRRVQKVPNVPQDGREELLAQNEDNQQEEVQNSPSSDSNFSIEDNLSQVDTYTKSNKTKSNKQQETEPDLHFPKPLSTPGLAPEDSMAEGGRKTLLYHFALMISHESGTRSGEDIEELHDMRVATRRMRAALDIFSSYYSPKAIKPIWKGLRRTGRNLGGVRDMDVLLDHLKGYIKTLPEAARWGMEPLVSEWQTERETRRSSMKEFLDSKIYKRFKIQMNRFVQTPAVDQPLQLSDYPTPTLVKEAAPLLIYTRLTSVRAYETILDHASLDQLHALRIEFKKLRYAVEFFREVLGSQAKDVIGTLKKVQDHLGELNDARVTCQLLTDFIARWEIQQIQQPIAERKTIEPIVAYLAARHADRHRLMVSFPETWDSFVHSDFRQALALAVAEL